MDEINPRKVILILGILAAGWWYLRPHIGVTKALAYARTHEQSSLSAPIQYYAGNYYYMASRPEEAAQAYEALLKSHPDDSRVPDAFFRLGNCYSELRRWGPARDAYQRCIDDARCRNRPSAERKMEVIKFR